MIGKYKHYKTKMTNRIGIFTIFGMIIGALGGGVGLLVGGLIGLVIDNRW